ncbi:beta-ketoacyl-ACP reductase [bacterium]|nr:MAG: beta-ketoacyl-ACP reductase [bacterium]
MTMGDRLAGKVAIVTGAGSGIGRTAAIRFAAEGAKVGCADRDRDGLDTTVQEILDSDGQAVACEVDVTDEKLVEQMVTETSDAFGAVTVLYSNAGIAGSGNAKDLTLAEWEKVIAVNLTSVWLCSRACLPGMIEAGGGSIINQASVGGLVGVPGIASYAAAKAGVIGLTKQMARRVRAIEVSGNAICPGTVPTPLVEKTYMARVDLPLRGRGLIRHRRTSRTIAISLSDRACGDDRRHPQIFALYLASDESAWTTGVVVPIDGGMTASRSGLKPFVRG